MVRKKLREKSAKVKSQTPVTHAIEVNPAALSRGQRKRLINKTHVIAKKSLSVLSMLKDKKAKKMIEDSVEKFVTEEPETKVEQPKKNKPKGSPKSQQKRNAMLLTEMQRFQSVMSNERVKEDPYNAIRQYLEARNISK